MNHDPIIITLKPYELLQACIVGCDRHISALQKGSRDRFNPDGEIALNNWNKHIIGSIGEMAAAKALRRYWSYSVDTYTGEADLAGDIEVRTRPYLTDPEGRGRNCLFVRPYDKDNRRYILARGHGVEWQIIGWIFGNEAKQERWLQSPGNYPYYVIPDDYLQDPRLLIQSDKGNLGDFFSDVPTLGGTYERNN